MVESIRAGACAGACAVADCCGSRLLPNPSRGGDAEKKVSDATNIAVFSLATKTSWKNDAGAWESRTEWRRCAAFGRLAEFAATLTKGTHVAVEGDLCSHEYQREITVGSQTTSVPQKVWEIRLDSVLKLDRTAKRESTGDGDLKMPR